MLNTPPMVASEAQEGTEEASSEPYVPISFCNTKLNSRHMSKDHAPSGRVQEAVRQYEKQRELEEEARRQSKAAVEELNEEARTRQAQEKLQRIKNRQKRDTREEVATKVILPSYRDDRIDSPIT